MNIQAVAEIFNQHYGYSSFPGEFAKTAKQKPTAQQWKDIAEAMGIPKRSRRTGKAARETIWVKHFGMEATLARITASASRIAA